MTDDTTHQGRPGQGGFDPWPHPDDTLTCNAGVSLETLGGVYGPCRCTCYHPCPSPRGACACVTPVVTVCPACLAYVQETAPRRGKPRNSRPHMLERERVILSLLRRPMTQAALRRAAFAHLHRLTLQKHMKLMLNAGKIRKVKYGWYQAANPE